MSRISTDKTSDRPIKLEARAAVATCECHGQRSGPCAPFRATELDAALGRLNTGKSRGPDGVPNQLLQQLSRRGKALLLELELAAQWDEEAANLSAMELVVKQVLDCS